MRTTHLVAAASIALLQACSINPEGSAPAGGRTWTPATSRTATPQIPAMSGPPAETVTQA